MPSIFAGMRREHVEAGVHRRPVVGGTPIAFERRIEHLAEPVDDHRLLHLGEHAVVNTGVIVGPFGRRGERPARHQDDAPARGLHRLDLFLIGADDIVDRDIAAGGEMIGAGAAGDHRAGPALGLGDRAGDQLPRFRPAEPHAALGGVHGFRHGQAEIPKIVAEAKRRFPVDSRRRARDRCRPGDRRRHGRRQRRCAGRRPASRRSIRIGSPVMA